jgi:hypothetical protein
MGVLAAGALAAAMLVAPVAAQAGSTASSTCGSSAGKCYALTVSPLSVAAGANASFSFTITNEASTQQLGSVRITAPSGFVITSAPGSASFTSSSALFLNLAIAPSGQATLLVSATAPCGAGASSYQWGIEAKQSNDFSGPPGNDFQLDPVSASNLAGSLIGSCSLAFVTTAEPTGTVAGKIITSSFNSSGGPVEVAVLDGSGHLATHSTAAVTVAISANPGSGTLSGTTTVNAIGGIASFANLSIDKVGTGYSLAASSTGITSTTSSFFTIWGSLSACSASASCSGSASSKTTAETVSTSGLGGVLGVGLGGTSYLCGSYIETSDPVTFDLLDSSGAPIGSADFSGTLEIFKNSVLASGHPGASTWQICYASTTSFTPLPNTGGTAIFGLVKYFTGLLPDCSSTQPAPCVQSRTKDNGGDVLITFLATGDPKTWA